MGFPFESATWDVVEGAMYMGVGGGFFMVPAMLYILGMSAKVVVGTSLAALLGLGALARRALRRR